MRKGMNKKKLIKLQDKCLSCENALNNALSELAIAASEILGYEVVADLCSGSEIEFRVIKDNDVPDSNSCIRMEDILSELKN